MVRGKACHLSEEHPRVRPCTGRFQPLASARAACAACAACARRGLGAAGCDGQGQDNLSDANIRELVFREISLYTKATATAKVARRFPAYDPPIHRGTAAAKVARPAQDVCAAPPAAPPGLRPAVSSCARAPFFADSLGWWQGRGKK